MNRGMCSRLRRSRGGTIIIPLRPGHTARLCDETCCKSLHTFRSLLVQCKKDQSPPEWCKTSSGSSYGKHLWDGEDESLSEQRKGKHLLSVDARSKSANWDGVKFITRGKYYTHQHLFKIKRNVCHLCCERSQSERHTGGTKRDRCPSKLIYVTQTGHWLAPSLSDSLGGQSDRRPN